MSEYDDVLEQVLAGLADQIVDLARTEGMSTLEDVVGRIGSEPLQAAFEDLKRRFDLSAGMDDEEQRAFVAEDLKRFVEAAGKDKPAGSLSLLALRAGGEDD